MAKTGDSQSESLPLRRLVVRVKIPVEKPPPVPVRPPLNRGALLLVVVAVAAMLSWLGISMFRAEPPPAQVATEEQPITHAPDETQPLPPAEVAPVPSDQPPPQSPSASDQVIPDVSRNALNTISGTIRVSIRVIVAKDGTVLAATADEPGPSRYFARLATEAARQWTFAPSDSDERRVKLVRFYFKRSGVTARVAE